MYKVGGILLGIGFAILLIAGILVGINFSQLRGGIEKMYHTEKTTITYSMQDIDSLKINTRESRVDFLDTQSDEIEVTYYKNDHFNYELSKEGTTLVLNKSKGKIVLFGFNISPQHTTIRVPKHLVKKLELVDSNAPITIENWDLDQLILQTSNGKISLNNINTTSDMTLKTSNASMQLDKITTKGVNAKTSNGSINLQKVKAETSIDFTTSNAKVIFEEVDAKEDIKVSSSSGSVSLSGINANDVTVHTSNASIILANASANNKFKLQTSNGKVDININNANIVEVKSSNSSIHATMNKKEETCHYTTNTSNASIYINEEKVGKDSFSSRTTGGETVMDLKTSNGAIHMNFAI